MAEFDIKTISCSSKIKAKIEVNIGSLESEYNGDKLQFEKIFAIDSGKGTKYTAVLRILDFGSISKSVISFFIADVQKLEIELNGAFSETNFKVSSDTADYCTADFCTAATLSNVIVSALTPARKLLGKVLDGKCCGFAWLLDDLIPEKIKSFKGDITIEFEPGPQMIYKEKFKNYVNSHLVFKPDGKEEDFQIVCQGEVYGFNRSILCNISPVFERMLTNPGFKQGKDGLIEIKDTTPEAIKAFRNILTLDYIEEGDLSIELFMFAHLYDIAPLFKLCQDYLCTAISEENLFDIIKAAHFAKDDELMSKAAEFIKGIDPETFNIEDNPEWDAFCKENPECAIKILNLMMFKKK